MASVHPSPQEPNVYQVLRKESLSQSNHLMVVDAPKVARKAQAGQFVIVRTDEHGERIPLTIADYDVQQGTVTIIFQEVGKSTMQMAAMRPGDGFATFVGPLGQPTEVEPYGTVVCVGGGVGIAPLFPIARALKAAGNEVITIIGARTRDLLFWEDRMRAVSDRLVVCTDDGSYGRHGLVTQPLTEVLEERRGEVSRVWAIGPAVMMKFACQATRPFGVHTIVSLNTVMVDGTGMCGGCRVLLDDGARFVCVDGPEFDGHRVDWELLLARQRFYHGEEELAAERWRHRCQLDGAVVRGGE